MKIVINELADSGLAQGAELSIVLQNAINERIAQHSDEFVQDMSHISTAATYAGNITVDQVEYLKENLYRCDYSYDWAIAWTCSGTQEAGRVKEKVRFTLSDNGELEFKFLRFD